jgi:RIO-like serine/threonine protein kinase
MRESRLLKKDLFGEVRLEIADDEAIIVRDAGVARAWLRWLARWLMRREARVLAVVVDIDGVPTLISATRDRLERRHLPGSPMHQARPTDPGYFKHALTLLRRLHAADVVHNDLAKEPNLLVGPDGLPAFIDFQLAWHAPGRGRLFRALAHDDIRHLLKHKRTYCPERLTKRQLAILASPSPLSKWWMRVVKPPYLFITRGILGWSDREGAADRGERR